MARGEKQARRLRVRLHLRERLLVDFAFLWCDILVRGSFVTQCSTKTRALVSWLCSRGRVLDASYFSHLFLIKLWQDQKWTNKSHKWPILWVNSTKVAFTLVHLTQYANSFYYMLSIFAWLKRCFTKAAMVSMINAVNSLWLKTWLALQASRKQMGLEPPILWPSWFVPSATMTSLVSRTSRNWKLMLR